MFETPPTYEFVSKTVKPLEDLAYYKLSIVLRELTLILEEKVRVAKAALEDVRKEDYSHFYIMNDEIKREFQLGTFEFPLTDEGIQRFIEFLGKWSRAHPSRRGITVKIGYYNPSINSSFMLEVSSLTLNLTWSPDIVVQQLQTYREMGKLEDHVEAAFNALTDEVYEELAKKIGHVDIFLKMHQLEQALR